MKRIQISIFLVMLMASSATPVNAFPRAEVTKKMRNGWKYAKSHAYSLVGGATVITVGAIGLILFLNKKNKKQARNHIETTPTPSASASTSNSAASTSTGHIEPDFEEEDTLLAQAIALSMQQPAPIFPNDTDEPEVRAPDLPYHDQMIDNNNDVFEQPRSEEESQLQLMRATAESIEIENQRALAIQIQHQLASQPRLHANRDQPMQVPQKASHARPATKPPRAEETIGQRRAKMLEAIQGRLN